MGATTFVSLVYCSTLRSSASKSNNVSSHKENPLTISGVMNLFSFSVPSSSSYPSPSFLWACTSIRSSLISSSCCTHHLPSEAKFQRIARRDKKAFLCDQCKELEENNRMGKTRGLLKKIRDTEGTFHAKMGTIKDRNGMDLTEAEEIKNRWQEYTEELYKKGPNYLDNHDGVITHLEPDILECEVKWALGSITTNKASGGDGISPELNPKRWCC